MRADLVASHNPQPTPRPKVGYGCADFRRLNASWKTCVAEKVRGGMSPSAASSAAAKENRTLRQQLVQAAAEHQELIRSRLCTCKRVEHTYCPVV